jgi:hypothetical protein
LNNLDVEQLSKLGDKVLKMGCKIVVIKCGKAGYYLRTSDHKQLLQLGRAIPINVTIDTIILILLYQKNIIKV